MFYENGYEVINAEQLTEYVNCGYSQTPVPLNFLRGAKCSLRMVGKPSEVEKALDYINEQLLTCGGSCKEFAMHFMCEELFGVKIFNVRRTFEQRTA